MLDAGRNASRIPFKSLQITRMKLRLNEYGYKNRKTHADVILNKITFKHDFLTFF